MRQTIQVDRPVTVGWRSGSAWIFITYKQKKPFPLITTGS
jgi:hypothetical protein